MASHPPVQTTMNVKTASSSVNNPLQGEGIDTSFLKLEVGPILARGLAETAAVRPEDPIEYLALWLLHYLDQKENREKKIVKVAEQEHEREERNKVRQGKQGGAAEVIQREWRHFMKMEESRAIRESKLREVIQEAEREIEEADEFREEAMALEEVEGMTDGEREKGMDRLHAQIQFAKAQRMISKLNKGAIAELKSIKKPSECLTLVVRCCCYLLLKSTPKQVRTWQLCNKEIKPAQFLEKAVSFVPMGAAKKARTFTRVRRILKGVESEGLRSESVAGFLLLQWLIQVIEYRARYIEEYKLKKEIGRDTEEEEDVEEEEEDPENEDKDPDEQIQKAIEIEEQRLRLEEEERLRRENGEEGAEGEELEE